MRLRGGFPSDFRGLSRAKIEFICPTLVLAVGESIDGVEAHEIPQAMAVIDKFLHALRRLIAPIGGVLRAALLDERPIHSEPSTPVVGLHADQLLRLHRRHCGQHLCLREFFRIFVELHSRAECTNLSSNRNAVVEELLLDIVLLVFEQHHHRLQIERRLLAHVSRLHRRGQPVVILVQHFRDRLQVLDRIVLDIEIQRDQRPVSLVAFFQRLFHDRTHLREEVGFNRGIVTRHGLRSMDQPRMAVHPSEIFLHHERDAGGDRAVEPVAVLAVIWKRVVCEHLCARCGDVIALEVGSNRDCREQSAGSD